MLLGWPIQPAPPQAATGAQLDRKGLDDAPAERGQFEVSEFAERAGTASGLLQRHAGEAEGDQISCGTTAGIVGGIGQIGERDPCTSPRGVPQERSTVPAEPRQSHQ